MQITKFDIVIPPQDIACEPMLPSKLSAGDRDAFAWVYKNYCKKVYNYAMFITGNNEQSEDIVQEVFYILWRNRQNLDTVKDFNGYMYVLYRNHILNTLKSQQKERKACEVYFRESYVPVKMADEIIFYKEKEQEITETVKLMPAQQQLIYKLREDGWRRDQIAKALNIAPNTVKVQVNKALRRLRKSGVRSREAGE